MNTTKRMSLKKLYGNDIGAALQDAFCYFDHAALDNGWFKDMATSEAANNGRRVARFLGIVLPKLHGRTALTRRNFYRACRGTIHLWGQDHGFDAQTGLTLKAHRAQMTGL